MPTKIVIACVRICFKSEVMQAYSMCIELLNRNELSPKIVSFICNEEWSCRFVMSAIG